MTEDAFADTAIESGDAFPYLVVRISDTVMKRYPICFISKSDKEFITPNGQSLIIALDESMIENDQYEITRDLVIDSARMHAHGKRHSVCVVFGENDYVQVERDGSVYEAAHLPKPAQAYDC